LSSAPFKWEICLLGSYDGAALALPRPQKHFALPFFQNSGSATEDQDYWGKSSGTRGRAGDGAGRGSLLVREGAEGMGLGPELSEKKTTTEE